MYIVQYRAISRDSVLSTSDDITVIFPSAHKNTAMRGGEFSIRNLSTQVKSVFCPGT